MGCQSDVTIGEYLTFSIVTHDPSTGVRTDADSPPTYRIYEDETGAPIESGTMTKLDPTRTGFYTERISVITSNGYEHGKSYNIAIEATVGGDTGGISFTFRAQTSLVSLILSVLLSHTSVSNAFRTEDMYLYRGDTWVQVISGLGDLTGYTELWFGIKSDPGDDDSDAIVLISESAGLERINGQAPAIPGNGAISIVGAPSAGRIQVDLDEVETAKLDPDRLFWDCQKLIGGVVTTPKTGRVVVTADIVRATS